MGTDPSGQMPISLYGANRPKSIPAVPLCQTLVCVTLQPIPNKITNVIPHLLDRNPMSNKEGRKGINYMQSEWSEGHLVQHAVSLFPQWTIRRCVRGEVVENVQGWSEQQRQEWLFMLLFMSNKVANQRLLLINGIKMTCYCHVIKSCTIKCNCSNYLTVTCFITNQHYHYLGYNDQQ